MQNTSAGLLIICGNSILLVKQCYDLHGTHLSIPKGGIMDNETPVQAAIRETYEETGILISYGQIEKTPYLLTIRTSGTNRYVIYYIVRIDKLPLKLQALDSGEITSAGFVNYPTAEKKMQVSQLSVLLHIYPDKIPARALNWLTYNGYIHKDTHTYRNLTLYNYTDKCKQHQYWNEITLWCRGIILDDQNTIKFRPLKKFFEQEQLYDYFLPVGESFDLYEKKDGTLGILYSIDKMPFITTRGSFTSMQAIASTALLYKKYTSTLNSLISTFSYFFEIVLPEDKHIIDYGDCRDLFLIGAYDNVNQREINLCELSHLPFKQVKTITDKTSLENLRKEDYENEEGYVAQFINGQRIKIKFQSYKEKYANKYH